MSESKFVHSLLLATPVYFYYQHLTPPGYFSNLLKNLVHLRRMAELSAAAAATAHADIDPITTR